MIWLYADESQRLTALAKALIDKHSMILCSPMVRLELQYLYEIGRINDPPDTIINDLSVRVGLRVCQRDFNLIISKAIEINWTRDTFDRLIVANAMVDDNILLTKDKKILSNYPHAVWDQAPEAKITVE